jgi:molybdopterin-guanine dinucleotide biosynthesis protein A
MSTLATLLPRARLAGVVMVGGRSLRMGRDKARLPHPATRKPLVLHQLGVLRATLGANAPLALSVRAGGDTYADLVPAVIARITDDGASGPLGGLLACINSFVGQAEKLVLLAVDLPAVTPELLGALVDGVANASAVGAVPLHPNTVHNFEPLCALYPISHDWINLVTRAVAVQEFALHRVIMQGVSTGLLQAARIAPSDEAFFSNWNTPRDLA